MSNHKIRLYSPSRWLHSLYNNKLTKIYNLTNKQPMEHPNAHAIRNSNRHARVRINTSIAGNVTKYNNLHTQEFFDKKILTLPNFA